MRAIDRWRQAQPPTALVEAIEVIVEAEEGAAPHMHDVVGRVAVQETPIENRQPRRFGGHEVVVDIRASLSKETGFGHGAADQRRNSRVARSSPSSVKGYMRSDISWRIT